MWHVLQVFYYDDNKESLLIEAIKPFVDQLRISSNLKRVYVRRHWKMGPHIDVFLDMDAENFQDQALPIANSIIGSWLQENPSIKSIDNAHYQKLSEKLGAWELEKGPYLPLESDNSIQTQIYDPKTELLQGTAVVEAKESFMVAAYDLVCELLKTTHGNKEKRYEMLMQMMSCIAECYPKGITYGHLSFRSHVEAYLREFDKDGKVLQVFENYDRKWSIEVDRLVQEVIEEFKSKQYFEQSNPLLHEWIKCLQDIWEDGYEKAKQNKFVSNTSHFNKLSQEIGEEARQRWSEEANVPVSEFHKNLMNQEVGLSTLNSPEFATYRLLVNNFYYLLPILNISPNEKQLLCYVVANSVERIKSITWKELMNYQES
jgi:hypothetical protein